MPEHQMLSEVRPGFAGVLILDEATSNLDEETARGFWETVNQLRGQVTVLVIAHERPGVIEVTQTVSLRAEVSQ
jgi:ABC-type bacteriocin/lantibiotic exporter with double-glycine peptidase domain